MTSTYTPKLAVPLYEDPEVVSTSSFNRPLSYMDGVVQHRDITARPFELRPPPIYNAGSNRIEVTFGPGRTYFGLALIEKSSGPPPAAPTTWQHFITSPATTTTYWIYLMPDGTTQHNTTGVAPGGAAPLYKIITGGSVGSLSYLDVRSELGATQTLAGLNATGYAQGSVLFVGAGGLVAQDNPNFFWDDTLNKLVLDGGGLQVKGVIGSEIGGKLLLPTDLTAGGIRFGSDAAAELYHSGAQTIRATGWLSAAIGARAPVFDATAPQGTAPLSVVSTSVVANLNADLHDGYHAGHAASQVPISDGILNTNLWADTVDGYHAGHAAGQVPISDGGLNLTLNADRLDGWESDKTALLNTVAVRDLNADLFVRQINSAGAGSETGTPAGLIGYNGADNFFRRYPPAQIRSLIQTIDGIGSGIDADFLRGMGPVRNGAGSIIAVADGTVVTNLNAHQVGGYYASEAATISTVVARTANGTGGYIYAQYFNATGMLTAGEAGPVIGVVGVQANDGFLRRFTPAQTMAMLTTVDGAGSGLDADYLDNRDTGPNVGNIPVNYGVGTLNQLNAAWVGSWDIAAILNYLSNTYQFAAANAGLTLSTTLTYVPGTAVVAPETSYYLIIGVFDFRAAAQGGGTADDGQTLYGCPFVAGVNQGAYASIKALCGDGSRTDNQASVCNVWTAYVGAGQQIDLRAAKSGGGGNSSVASGNTKLIALKMRM